MPNRLPELRRRPPAHADGLDVLLGAAEVAAATAVAVRRALEPALLPERLRPLHLLAACTRPLGRRGRVLRTRLVAQGTQGYETLLPTIVERVLECLPLTELVRRHVDLDELVATVDLDAAVGRLDVQAVVAMIDLDEVTRHLDIEAVLDRMDLTATVLDRVDMQKVVDGVLTQVDLAAIVSQVLEEVDLPEVIRESTGTMASDTVRSVRMRGVNADQGVTRSAAWLLQRRSRQHAEALERDDRA